MGFFLSCVRYAFVHVCLYVPCGRSPAGKGLTSWLSFVMSNCEFVTIGILGQVYHLIVLIPDLCTLTYFESDVKPQHTHNQIQ